MNIKIGVLAIVAGFAGSSAFLAESSTPIDAEAKNAPTSARLFFLDLSGGRILSANPDGSDLKTIINEGRHQPPNTSAPNRTWRECTREVSQHRGVIR